MEQENQESINRFLDKTGDAILDQLPAEAIEELAELSPDEEHFAEKVSAILKRNGVDAKETATKMVKEYGGKV